jgi:hypothetical protein
VMKTRVNFSILDFQLPRDEIVQVTKRSDGARLGIGNGDLERLLDGEEDGQGVEGVDPGIGEGRLGLEKVVRNVFFLADDGDQLLFDLAAGHDPYHKAVYRRFWLLYPAWIAVCAILFVALSGLEDPSRPKGRILSIEAGVRALDYARERGLAGYEVVHVARNDDRWVVLVDKVPHTRLREAMVVEVKVEDGTLLRIRKPA